MARIARYGAINPGFQPIVDYIIWLAKYRGVDYIPNQHHLKVEDSLYSYKEEVIIQYKSLVSELYPVIPTGPFLDLDSYDYTNYVPSITNPTLLINGALEYVVDRDDAFELFTYLDADAKDLLIVGNASHLVVLEQIAHARLNWAVASWLLQ